MKGVMAPRDSHDHEIDGRLLESGRLLLALAISQIGIANSAEDPAVRAEVDRPPFSRADAEYCAIGGGGNPVAAAAPLKAERRLCAPIIAIQISGAIATTSASVHLRPRPERVAILRKTNTETAATSDRRLRAVIG
jgi:hypothetical protein